MNAVEKIQVFRKTVDIIDDEIVKLLNRRVNLVKTIGTIKRANNLPIEDSQREKEVLDRIPKKLYVGFSDKDVKAIFGTIMDVCKGAE